jgi:release factor glutamine methyltransferase
MNTRLAAVLAEASRTLQQAGFEEPRRHARRLIAAALDMSTTETLVNGERRLDASERQRIDLMVRRLVDREPLSRILGHREFWGLDCTLSADTLDPRPDSETLVEAVLDEFFDRAATLDFLDLGTGTGCLLLALLREYPGARGVGVDIAEGAARTARQNALALGLGGRARFFVGEWCQALSGTFDAVVVNPPYIETAALADLPHEVSRFDPPCALDGGADGLVPYRSIAGDLLRLLRPGGILAAEIGCGQAAAVAAILDAAGLIITACRNDLAGTPRCIVARAPAAAAGLAQKTVGIAVAPV